MTTFRRLMVSLPDSKRQTLTRSLEVSAQKYACAMIVPYPTYNEANSVDQRSKTEIGGYDGERLKFALSGVCEVAAPARLRRSASPARPGPYRHQPRPSANIFQNVDSRGESLHDCRREGLLPKSKKSNIHLYYIVCSPVRHTHAVYDTVDTYVFGGGMR